MPVTAASHTVRPSLLLPCHNCVLAYQLIRDVGGNLETELTSIFEHSLIYCSPVMIAYLPAGSFVMWVEY